jgi:uncharacterized protein (TIGR02145 family)
MDMKKVNGSQVNTSLSILFAVLVLSTSCKKKSDDSSSAAGLVPAVTTGNYNHVLINTIEFTGNITSDHGSKITKSGFCWSSTNQFPTIQDDTLISSASSGATFNDTIKRLKGKTLYYLRAYATNSNGTGYGNPVAVTTIDTTISDVENNHYHIVQIGTQVWMAENLRTTKFNDGTTILYVPDDQAWSDLLRDGYCWYNNDVTNKATYGAMYNWYAVTELNFCPPGWHIPTDVEWNTLTAFLGGEASAGGKLKEAGTVHWASPNTGATNSSGFGALPGGARANDGGFFVLTQNGYYWSSVAVTTVSAWGTSINYNDAHDDLSPFDNRSGFSVRCIRN